MSKIYSRRRIRIPQVNFLRSRKFKIKNKKLSKILIILIIAFSTVKIVLNAILPIFDNLCLDKAKSIATLISNEQATNVMKQYTYDELYSIEKDNDGNITMIKSNVSPINEITSDIAIKIQNEIDKQSKNNIKISLGNFTGFKMFSGSGPSINIKISSTGNVETDLKSEFIEEGINQTLHRVYLQVVCEIIILTPYNNLSSRITNQVLIMENIIIGKIPETYYNINGLEGETNFEFIE